jgi:hypothetical protein
MVLYGIQFKALSGPWLLRKELLLHMEHEIYAAHFLNY